MSTAFSVFKKIEASPQVAVHGQVLTKSHIVELMLDLSGYRGERSVRLLDPGCGEGAFAIAAAVRLVRGGGIPKRFEDVADCIRGIDKDEAAIDLCRNRIAEALVAEGVASKLAKRLAKHWIIAGDFLEHEFSHRFNFVVGNPPYVRQEAIPKDKLAVDPKSETTKWSLLAAREAPHGPRRGRLHREKVTQLNSGLDQKNRAPRFVVFSDQVAMGRDR